MIDNDGALHIDDWKGFVRENFNNEEKEYLKDILIKLSQCDCIKDVEILAKVVIERGFSFQNLANLNVFYCIIGIHMRENKLISFETLSRALEQLNIGVIEAKGKKLTDKEISKLANETFNELKIKYEKKDTYDLIQEISDKLNSYDIFICKVAKKRLSKIDFEGLSHCIKLLQKMTNDRDKLIFICVYFDMLIDKYGGDVNE